ncbi:MAG: DUF3126 family protein [Magnetovibrio sp.]|nr:DUF3126 family protein [Magnetovibrio sp.]
MEIAEIARVQEYLRKSLSNNRIVIAPPTKPDAPIEVYIADEFIGVLYKDEDEGEVSYSLMMTILEIDLPPIGGVPLIPKK